MNIAFPIANYGCGSLNTQPDRKAKASEITDQEMEIRYFLSKRPFERINHSKSTLREITDQEMEIRYFISNPLFESINHSKDGRDSPQPKRKERRSPKFAQCIRVCFPVYPETLVSRRQRQSKARPLSFKR
jgi:hypothetical protein